MVEVTDRILAKSVIRILGVFASQNGLPRELTSKQLLEAFLFVVGDNIDLKNVLGNMIEEVSLEIAAEVQGTANSTISSPDFLSDAKKYYIGL